MRPCVGALLLGAAAILAAPPPARITIDYPQDGSVFPPDFAAPRFLWRDAAESARLWRIEVAFAGRAPRIRVETAGEAPGVGEIDPRAVSQTNELPRLSPELAAARTWRPEAAVWEAIKRASAGRPAVVTITGFSEGRHREPVSQGRLSIRTSRDPVGAPIFYRDVPLMPSELEKGVIKPLDRAALPLIAWRLRYVGDQRSRLLLDGLHTCANCHSFSSDGKTLGMDLDGPRNDKGLYTIASVEPRVTIRNQDVVSWTAFLGRQKGELRIGFMSQVSPDGQYVVTMVNRWPEVTPPPQAPPRRARHEVVSHFYVANFKDYRFLQVFYPTRGILAWYSRATGRLQPLPGADDPRYVHTNAVWSPDGKYLIFARAPATEPYPAGRKLAERANDPNETPIQYDLYRIPFNGGRGGNPEPVAGASRNGMSNSFPKVSPDGRWIVFVQCRNGLLMRPDSQLYIVPAQGGKARRMRCNTALMNSWHSFSPNGRWLVFSSKARSPYTEMYLTHLDHQGRDSPPILIENATAANRAVNLPEFVNVAPDGLVKIDVPAVQMYRLFDQAWELTEKGHHEAAVAAWRRVLEVSPGEPKAHMNLGVSLARTGKLEEAIQHQRTALELDPEYPEAHLNLGVALAALGRWEEAIRHCRMALELDPEYAEAHSNLGAALAGKGQLEQAVAHYRKALEVDPKYAEVYSNLGVALARMGKLDEALPHFQKAAELNPGSAEVQANLAVAYGQAGRFEEALAAARRALALAVEAGQAALAESLRTRIAVYAEKSRPHGPAQLPMR